MQYSKQSATRLLKQAQIKSNATRLLKQAHIKSNATRLLKQAYIKSSAVRLLKKKNMDKKAQAGRGAAIGGLLGAGVGALLPADSWKERVMRALGLGAGGAASGGLVGHGIAQRGEAEGWRDRGAMDDEASAKMHAIQEVLGRDIKDTKKLPDQYGFTEGSWERHEDRRNRVPGVPLTEVQQFYDGIEKQKKFRDQETKYINEMNRERVLAAKAQNRDLADLGVEGLKPNIIADPYNAGVPMYDLAGTVKHNKKLVEDKLQWLSETLRIRAAVRQRALDAEMGYSSSANRAFTGAGGATVATLIAGYLMRNKRKKKQEQKSQVGREAKV